MVGTTVYFHIYVVKTQVTGEIETDRHQRQRHPLLVLTSVSCYTWVILLEKQRLGDEVMFVV